MNQPDNPYRIWQDRVSSMERDVPYTSLQRGLAALLGWHRWDGQPGNYRKPYWWKPDDGSTVKYPIAKGRTGYPRSIDIIYCYDPADLFRHEGAPNPEEHNHEDNIQVARLPAE